MTAASNTISTTNQWEHHEVSFFPILSNTNLEPSGSSYIFRIPTIEKIREFHYSSIGNYATLVCQGTHNESSADDVRTQIMAPGRHLNLFICRYDATPNFRRDGAEYYQRHTVHNLRVRVVEFHELQTQITINHETGRTDIKKVMKFLFEVMGPMDLGFSSTSTINTSTIAARSTTVEPYLSTLSTLTSLNLPSL